MKYIFDMIHHNPGEKAFDTRFSDPEHIKGYGFNGQAFKHINTVMTFEKVAPGVFPANEEERRWLDKFTADREEEIRAAKAAGLAVFYHVDLFVLPKRIIEHFREEIINPETGRVSIDRPKTLELHRALIDELFERFPQIDGLIIRVGETYLFDTPYHGGNGAVRYEEGAEAKFQHDQFIKLLDFLRNEVCVKHDKTLIHRTWDTCPDRFHASLDFYLSVTNDIEPHPNLIFSIKHSMYDFQRWIPFNACLGEGKHRQVIEVQCQREYEGKGAYPNYSTWGVINGFSEMKARCGEVLGIKDVIESPLICGVYTWSRGGGWYGPYVTSANELWCDLNAYVIAHYAENPARGEEAIFNDYCTQILKLEGDDIGRFREIALLSLDAVLKGKCCAAFDKGRPKDAHYPTNMYMRDDVLEGYDHLDSVFEVLVRANTVEAALEEKREAAALWTRMRELCDQMDVSGNPQLKTVLTASVEYGLRYFSAIECLWRVLLHQYAGMLDKDALAGELEAFDRAWSLFQRIQSDYPEAATPHRLCGWSWPGKTPAPGAAAEVEKVRASLAG